MLVVLVVIIVMVFVIVAVKDVFLGHEIAEQSRG